MKCFACDGTMSKVPKDVSATWKGRTVTFRGMQVWVCGSCGEEAYEPDDVRLMQGLIDGTSGSSDYPELMNVEEVADLLRVSSQTIYKLARQGKIPATKIGREWRFSRPALLEVLRDEGEQATVGLAARDAAPSGISPKDAVVIAKHLNEMKESRDGT